MGVQRKEDKGMDIKHKYSSRLKYETNSPTHVTHKTVYNSLPPLVVLLSGAIKRVLTLVGVSIQTNK